MIHVVPWFDRNEWLLVEDDVCSNDPNRLWKAVRRMAIWDCRVPRLPKAVEGTLRLTYVYCKDHSFRGKYADESCANESDILLMYSAVLIRFLNFTLDVQEKSSRTMYQQAASVNIPDWIVQLRHDISHGETLPSLSLARMAVKYLLEWLRETYWVPESKLYKTISVNLDKYEDIIKVYNLWIYIGRKLSDGVTHISGIINDVDENSKDLLELLQNKYWDNRSFEQVYLYKLDNVLKRLLHDYLVKRCWRRLIDYILSEDNSIFLSENCIEYRFDGSVNTGKLHNLWLKIVRLLLGTSRIIYFLELLVKIGNRGSPTIQLLASNWTKNLIDILQTMSGSDNEETTRQNKVSNNKKKRKRTKDEDQDNDMKSMLNLVKEFKSTFDLSSFADDLRDILRLALLHPHRYTSVFIRGLFSIQIISLEERRINMLLNLLDIFVNRQNCDSFENSSSLYMIHSLINDGSPKTVEDSDKQQNISNDQLESSTWKKCSDKEIWSRYPLGMLPKEYSKLSAVPPPVHPIPNDIEVS